MKLVKGDTVRLTHAGMAALGNRGLLWSGIVTKTPLQARTVEVKWSHQKTAHRYSVDFIEKGGIIGPDDLPRIR